MRFTRQRAIQLDEMIEARPQASLHRGNGLPKTEELGFESTRVFTSTVRSNNRRAMKPRMTEQAVAMTAQAFWDAQEELHLKTQGRSSIMRGLRVANVRLDQIGKRRFRWVVQFSSKTPSGGVIDSPPLVIVNDATGTATFSVEV